MSDHQQQRTGQDSRVEDWFGQSVQRDMELAEELTAGSADENEAEREFAARATGEAEQERRHGDTIDPDQGRSAYLHDAPSDDERSGRHRVSELPDDPDSPGATIDDDVPAEPNEPA